jgi:hypothetical protein
VGIYRNMDKEENMRIKNAAKQTTELCRVLKCGRIIEDGTCYGFHSPELMWVNFETFKPATWCWGFTLDQDVIPKTERAIREYSGRWRKCGCR